MPEPAPVTMQTVGSVMPLLLPVRRPRRGRAARSAGGTSTGERVGAPEHPAPALSPAVVTEGADLPVGGQGPADRRDPLRVARRRRGEQARGSATAVAKAPPVTVASRRANAVS